MTQSLPLTISQSEQDRLLEHIRLQINLLDPVRFSMIDKWGSWIPVSYRRAVKADLIQKHNSLPASDAMKKIVLNRIAVFLTNNGKTPGV